MGITNLAYRNTKGLFHSVEETQGVETQAVRPFLQGVLQLNNSFLLDQWC